MWWNVIKNDSVLTAGSRQLYKKLGQLTSHPDFNLGGFNERSGEHAKTIFQGFDKTSSEAQFTEAIVNTYSNSVRDFIDGLNDIFKEHQLLTGNRSMKILREMASDFGIDININMQGYPNQPYKVEFSYGGLRYQMHDGGLSIYVGHSAIWVCVVDTAKLPIGDFYGSLLGILKNDPARIPTLEFGIRLANILRPHESSLRAYFPKGLYVEIHTPFVADEIVNEDFEIFIDKLKKNMRRDILGEIKQALKETVGNDGGFF